MHKSDNSMGGRHLRDGRSGIAEGASMKDVIAFILGNFTLTFFGLGLLASAIALRRARPPRSFALVVEALFSYFVLFSIGFSNLYNFVLHVFFGKLAASFIGWEDSPFQLEVGFASLGFALVGLLAFRGSFDLRLAAIVGPAGFLWGAAGGHVYQMITAHNFAPGNAGVIFYGDILVPNRRLHISVAATPRGPIAAGKVSVTAKMPVEAVASAGR